MSERTLKHVHDWNIELQRQNDSALPWRAIALQMTDHEFATGMDPVQALTILSQKIGINPQDVLREFGF